jgi:hypothetical protein
MGQTLTSPPPIEYNQEKFSQQTLGIPSHLLFTKTQLFLTLALMLWNGMKGKGNRHSPGAPLKLECFSCEEREREREKERKN